MVDIVSLILQEHLGSGLLWNMFDTNILDDLRAKEGIMLQLKATSAHITYSSILLPYKRLKYEPSSGKNYARRCGCSRNLANGKSIAFSFDVYGKWLKLKIYSDAGEANTKSPLQLRKFVKRKLSDMSESQRCESSDEASSRSGSGDSDTYPNRDTMTVKAEYGDDLIAFHIPASAATLTALKKETWEGFELNNVSYELAYLDNVNDFILLNSDEELRVAPLSCLIGRWLEVFKKKLKDKLVNIGLTWKDTIANLNLSDIVDEQISGSPS
ncbi:NIN-like protein [Tanacetum coccineum]